MVKLSKCKNIWAQKLKNFINCKNKLKCIQIVFLNGSWKNILDPSKIPEVPYNTDYTFLVSMLTIWSEE